MSTVLTDDKLARITPHSYTAIRGCPEPADTRAAEGYRLGVAAWADYVIATEGCRSDPRLTPLAKRERTDAAAEAALAALDRAEVVVEHAEGDALSLEQQWRGKVAPQSPVEIARFAEIRAHARGLPLEDVRRLPFSANAEHDIELLRALVDGPKFLNLLPLDDVRTKAEAVAATAVAPKLFAQWQALAAQIPIARALLVEARAFVVQDKAMSDEARSSRDRDAAHRALLVEFNKPTVSA